MPDSLPDPLHELLARLREARDAAAQDPFGDPVLLIALAISRRMDDGLLDLEGLTALVQRLSDQAAADRARRIAAYVGLDAGPPDLRILAERLVRPDPEDSPIPFARFRALVETPRFAAVFTAHPTFSLPQATGTALAEAASGAEFPAGLPHRPPAPTLADEFEQAVAAIQRGRDALDGLAAALLDAARGVWGDRWTTLVPRPVLLASWVGYDTDGRTDIGWWDTLRLRLVMKRLQLDRLQAQLDALGDCAAPIAARIAAARDAVAAQVAAVPEKPEAEAVARLAAEMVGRRDVALTGTAPLLDLFPAAIAAAPDDAARQALVVARAGLAAHGLALAHTHVRLNAAQVHNAVRQRLGLAASADDMAQRRGLLGTINAALGEVQAQPVDFGALIAEQASAARLMLVCAQIAKHVDGSAPIRFLIAETETGYTLLAALWLAKRFGAEQAVELSPLFETAEALDRGERVLEEALRSPHYRDYVRRHGRLCLQFGYSDSGRYVGQLAGSYLAERLKLRLVELLRRHKLDGIEVVLFDTHGESVGRGGHPDSLADRLAYLSPPQARGALDRAGLRLREETAFQGGDGYLLFGTPRLAEATIAGIAAHAFAPAGPVDDPVYAEADYVADFFATVRKEMQALVEDPGYAALLGAFGPGLLDRTGSRPAVRQSDGMGGPVRISHPSQLRAIPNNAILQQLGWMANSLHGLGTAATANPDAFNDLRARSPRFKRALALAARAAACSDLGVLRAVVDTLDPGPWLDRAGFTRRPGRREELLGVAATVERLDLDAPVRRLFRRLQADHLSLRHAWPDLPAMPDRLVLLHALRLALIHRIWLLAATLPEFSPRHGATRESLALRILQLDIAPAVALLEEIFPAAPGAVVAMDFHEPAPEREGLSYAREHAGIFRPMARLFDLVRGCGAAITHEVGAFG
ncbi:phosphoenolpyruvate carboxylase [Paracraurococcus ruber]|uniref:Phosphoenolpyruvate carboxylase n=1 Tax=Paracraurococcus ruber TaxID=77675 RepID=A0ABS1D1F1_9PROT|nr:phosphoenolpyruvate carboxylase [Paracraurococcus ruber]MBK1660644.1 phosphoenolpyruvate carboxylase [Paracraurococcus ruber]TDG26596.1 phosphoenolpyruvate carboxylase [Paracraurococcus ruber]